MSEVSKREPIKDLEFFDQTLNPSQREAIKFAMESPEVACIHGPPGGYTLKSSLTPSYLMHF